MTTKQLLQICLLTSSSFPLFSDRRPNNIVSALYSRRISNSGRQRHRRAESAPSSLSIYYHPNETQNPGRSPIGEAAHYLSICRLGARLGGPIGWTTMGLERRLSRASPIAPVSLDAVLNVSSIDLGSEAKASATMTPTPSSLLGEGDQAGQNVSTKVDVATSTTMPPPPPTNETSETRSIRSASSASRNANRLSLTLPIALPTSISSRPTPTSSVPPTPIDTSSFNSPVESDASIVAIAAQERRVLELREELARAETELKRLQRQWTVSEGCKKRPPNNTSTEPFRALAPAATLRDSREDIPAVKRNSELERRKAILLAQSQATPRQHKRTVMRGSHARTLSLLSPSRLVEDASIHDEQDSIQSPDSYMSCSPIVTGYPLNKRATWAPRPASQQPTGVKQLANDFKHGLWTFVEDLRQATVGDEAISGTTNRTTEMSGRSNRIDGGQDTVRATNLNRGRIPIPAELDSPLNSPTRSSTNGSNDRFQHRRTASRPEPRVRKHYSWTPLTFESLDDDDWSSWDTPNVKTSRWSGSTANGEVPAIPEKADENEAAL